MDRLNVPARMMLKGILGKERSRHYLDTIERLLLDNYDEASIRGVARQCMVPESTLRCILGEVRKEVEWICKTENVEPGQLLSEDDDAH